MSLRAAPPSLAKQRLNGVSVVVAPRNDIACVCVCVCVLCVCVPLSYILNRNPCACVSSRARARACLLIGGDGAPFDASE